MTKLLTSSTILLAFCFAFLGVALIFADAAYFQFTGNHLSYVIEFYGMMGTLFLGVSAKNGVDSVTSYKRDTITYQKTGTIPAAPVKQS